MVDALKVKNAHTANDTDVLNQMLHGYSEGHRLIEASINIPDDISRTVLRLSDLSGTNVVRGFEEYITGYPLPSIGAYALAKSWYAAEMPRPGCVWTHTILVPHNILGEVKSLSSLRMLFKRPDSRGSKSFYSKPLFLEDVEASMSNGLLQSDTFEKVLYFHYQTGSTPVLIGARNSSEFESMVFALWSQKWPKLRNDFTFCTGSLSARTYNKRPLDIQCVPIAKVREVLLELTASGTMNPVVANAENSEPYQALPSWASLAVKDALAVEGGFFREFLWTVSDDSAACADFRKYSLIFYALQGSPSIDEIISLVAMHFPEATEGRQLKATLFTEKGNLVWASIDSSELLATIATTSHYSVFNCDDLRLVERCQQLSVNEPDKASRLVEQLFRSALNPLGEQILAGLVSAIQPEAAHRLTSKQLQLLPALFAAKPSLAISSQLWALAGDKRRDLFEAIAAHQNVSQEIVRGTINGLLENGGDWLIGKALDRWGKPAVQETINWIASHNGSMSELCRHALQRHPADIREWMDEHPIESVGAFVSLVRVASGDTSSMLQSDSSTWFEAYRKVNFSGKASDDIYSCAFLLTLGLNNAPPAPLKLISRSFCKVHEAARIDMLSDSAWMMLEPTLPELTWYSNWDKCERLRRGLIRAFVRYGWPPHEIKSVIADELLLNQVRRSADRVEGGDLLIRRAHL
ncbi:MAG: hypothetical protein OEV08_01820 [Nitrospira sp.]|nr:hypothetical protein [Nitrospira sp.]